MKQKANIIDNLDRFLNTLFKRNLQDPQEPTEAFTIYLSNILKGKFEEKYPAKKSSFNPRLILVPAVSFIILAAIFISPKLFLKPKSEMDNLSASLSSLDKDLTNMDNELKSLDEFVTSDAVFPDLSSFDTNF